MKAIFTVALIALPISSCNLQSKPESESVATPVLEPCRIGTPVTGKIYPKNKDTWLYSAPDKTSPRIINQRSRDVLGKAYYVDVSPSYVLEAECQHNGFIEAKIIEVEGKAKNLETGWIEESAVNLTPPNTLKN